MDAPDARSQRPKRPTAVLGFVAGVALIVAMGVAIGWRLNWFAAAPDSVAIGDTRPRSNFTTQELRGQALYYANCASCHGGPSGGGMMDYPPRHNSNGHTWHHPDCELRQIIREGGDEMTAAMREMMAPPDAPKMLAFRDKLSDPDIDAVLAYIKTMWYAGQRELQAEVTHGSCAS